MKRLFLSTAIVSCLVATGAQASDGQINFQGQLTDSTCQIAIDGSPSPALVVLPTLSVQALAAPGAVAGRTQFNIELSGCTGLVTTSTAAAYFENGASVDSTTNNLVNTTMSGAGNVQLQLIDAQSNMKIDIGRSSQASSNTPTIIDGAGTGTTILPYAVQYYALGATTAGPVTSDVSFSINYQ
ncbi:major type 1 subunit fimbrin (pilin) [Klebsiella oxytoca]|uniref:Major type 1 subunit fimbrin (Pilin) n=1 Tax=Klebsiella oxytoca TaxID=571 RepID=A0A318G292_KLEOX|nr:fimbrial protein [Klebsiella oxytoca]PXW48748.1 major type 1 subunit fimbrin (pilin) [Klebsiella oxytoca]